MMDNYERTNYCGNCCFHKKRWFNKKKICTNKASEFYKKTTDALNGCEKFGFGVLLRDEPFYRPDIPEAHPSIYGNLGEGQSFGLPDGYDDLI